MIGKALDYLLDYLIFSIAFVGAVAFALNDEWQVAKWAAALAAMTAVAHMRLLALRRQARHAEQALVQLRALQARLREQS